MRTNGATTRILWVPLTHGLDMITNGKDTKTGRQPNPFVVLYTY
jgi:hypothetical protein